MDISITDYADVSSWEASAPPLPEPISDRENLNLQLAAWLGLDKQLTTWLEL